MIIDLNENLTRLENGYKPTASAVNVNKTLKLF